MRGAINVGRLHVPEGRPLAFLSLRDPPRERLDAVRGPDEGRPLWICGDAHAEFFFLFKYSLRIFPWIAYNRLCVTQPVRLFKHIYIFYLNCTKIHAQFFLWSEIYKKF